MWNRRVYDGHGEKEKSEKGKGEKEKADPSLRLG
jgi:hypothetical protein